MLIPQSPCPERSILYNNSQCACLPGYLFNSTSKSCRLFDLSPDSEWVVKSGVNYSFVFPESIISLEKIRKLTQSQAVFLQATVVLLLSWLLFCFLARFGKLGNGRSLWFQIRWWISRLDLFFATRHWLDDQKVVKKRKTELGGAFSIASLILFVGMLAALLYQIICQRTVEVNNLRATNLSDLLSFVNDLEFNITTVSSMSCSQLRGLGTLLMGKPGMIGFREASLLRFANFSCLNTSNGPRINLKCSNCHIAWGSVYISWQFVDILNQPATAVGFQFSLTAKNPVYKGHVSLVSGTVKNGSNMDDPNPKAITFRGKDTNVLQFNLLPRVHHNIHSMKLVQPLFHGFLPGSFLSDENEFKLSLQNSNNGLINITLFFNFLSDYIVEIDNRNILGPVSILADLGGLYCISMGIFYYLLVQCEYRVKRLRDEDKNLRSIRSRCKAQDHWETLRKYVIYTWGCKKLQERYMYIRDDECCTSSMTRLVRMSSRPSHKKRLKEINLHTISFDRGDSSPKEKVEPPPALREFNGGSAASADEISEIQKSLQSLYEYNIMLRDKFLDTQSKLDSLTTT